MFACHRLVILYLHDDINITKVYVKVCQLHAEGWFPPGTLVSSTSETDIASS